jgi:hypothetical protein
MSSKFKTFITKSILPILISTFIVITILYAWQEPTQPPPQGNVSAPINVSASTQIKAGPLALNASGTSPTGLIVNRDAIFLNGNVGIGTTNPTQKLDVAGYVKGTGLCIGSDCRTSWPSGGGNLSCITTVCTDTGPVAWGVQSCTTFCPSGYIVTGGGVSSWRAIVNASYPYNNGWACQVTPRGEEGDWDTMSCYAICCKIQ